MKQRTRSRAATILGVLTSIVTAAELVDFDTLDYSSVNTYVKLLVLLLPAIGGWMSEVKSPSADNAGAGTQNADTSSAGQI